MSLRFGILFERERRDELLAQDASYEDHFRQVVLEIGFRLHLELVKARVSPVHADVIGLGCLATFEGNWRDFRRFITGVYADGGVAGSFNTFDAAFLEPTEPRRARATLGETASPSPASSPVEVQT